MYWVYILKCKNNVFYIGMTGRLFRRMWEHRDGKGGLNTEIFKPLGVVAIYKVNKMMNFLIFNEYICDILNKKSPKKRLYQGFNNPKYLIDIDWNKLIKCHKNDAEWVENQITETMIINNPIKWKNIRGGNYVQFSKEYKFPINEYIKKLPLCECKLPCDVVKKDKKIYFRCPKKNFWFDIEKNITIYNNKVCKYYLEYTHHKKLFEERKKFISNLFKKSLWLLNIQIISNDCIGGCHKKKYKKITYHGKNINLCYDCFINKNDKLNNQFSKKVYNGPDCNEDYLE
jgi:predicted GIY-YIG superfamily endonuclease